MQPNNSVPPKNSTSIEKIDYNDYETARIIKESLQETEKDIPPPSFLEKTAAPSQLPPLIGQKPPPIIQEPPILGQYDPTQNPYAKTMTPQQPSQNYPHPYQNPTKTSPFFGLASDKTDIVKYALILTGLLIFFQLPTITKIFSGISQKLTSGDSMVSILSGGGIVLTFSSIYWLLLAG